MHNFIFGIYPYIALAVMFVGSIIRYDREPYSWRSGSSQMLRKRQLFWGSNLFHFGILFLFFGHFVGLLTPHWAYIWLISAHDKQILAVVSGGIAGAHGSGRADCPFVLADDVAGAAANGFVQLHGLVLEAAQRDVAQRLNAEEARGLFTLPAPFIVG